VPYREDEDAALARADALQVELDATREKLEQVEDKLAVAGDAERKLAATEEELADTEAELARHRHDDPVVDAPPVRVDAEPVVVPPVMKASTPAPSVPSGPRPTAGAMLAVVLILAVLAGIVVAIVEFS